jgi:hypothetical protein
MAGEVAVDDFERVYGPLEDALEHLSQELGLADEHGMR